MPVNIHRNLDAVVAQLVPDIGQRFSGLNQHAGEVAVYFGISERTAYRLLDEGDLQATRIRRCLRVSAEEIRRFEEALADAYQY